MNAAFRFYCFIIFALLYFEGNAQTAVKDTGKLSIHLNMPLFLREGDRLELAATITNLSEQEQTGQVQLQLTEALSQTSVDGWFQNIFPVQYFTVDAGGTTVVQFPLEVPYLFKKPVQWRITAQGNTGTIRETAVIPVLTDKQFVTETKAFPVRPGSHTISFKKLLQAEATEHHSVTVQLFQNPIWQVAAALPFLAYESGEDAMPVWNRFYATALALHLQNTAPSIAQLTRSWKNDDTSKQISFVATKDTISRLLREEMPWVMQAISEKEEQRQLTTFFDSASLQARYTRSLEQLEKQQNKNGSFSFLPHSPEDRFFTQVIVAGIGHLKKLGALSTSKNDNLQQRVITAVLAYLDQQLAADYQKATKQLKGGKAPAISPEQIFYLYERNYFPEFAIAKETASAFQFYGQQAQATWEKQSNLLQAMTALYSYRSNDKKTAAAILKSLKKTVLTRTNNNLNQHYTWWQSPLEEKAVLLEAIREIEYDSMLVSSLQTQILAAGLTNNQPANALAATYYALLLEKNNNLNNNEAVTIQLGKMEFATAASHAEWQKGYFKKIIEVPHVVPELGTIKINRPLAVAEKNTHRPLHGVINWNSFQEPDSVSDPNKDLKLSKKLFLKRAAKNVAITENTVLQIGDTIQVQLILTTNKALQNIQLLDAYAAASKPVLPLSTNQISESAGFQQTLKRSGVNFWLPLLPKGTIALNYSLVTTHAGTFNNGQAWLRSVYTPHLLAHSEAMRIQIE